MSKSLYQDGAPESERKRQETFDYPNQVSRQMLSALLPFSSILDMGCRANPAMAIWAKDHGITYTGVDSGLILDPATGRKLPTISLLQKELGKLGVPASLFLEDLFSKSPYIKKADIVHARFILAHMPEARRKKAVELLCELANKAVVILEFDWGTMKSSKSQDVLDEFIFCSMMFMSSKGIASNLGANLAQFVPSQTLATEDTEWLRPERDYTSELLGLLNVQLDVAMAKMDAGLVGRLQNLRVRLQKSPIEFVPAAINARTIYVS